jgi:hypothetical protein
MLINRKPRIVVKNQVCPRGGLIDSKSGVKRPKHVVYRIDVVPKHIVAEPGSHVECGSQIIGACFRPDRGWVSLIAHRRRCLHLIGHRETDASVSGGHLGPRWRGQAKSEAQDNSCKHSAALRHNDCIAWFELDILLRILALDNVFVIKRYARLSTAGILAKNVNMFLASEISEAAGGCNCV